MNDLLIKPLIALSLLLALISSVFFFLYRSDHQALVSLKTQYKQLQVVSEEQGKTITSLNTNRIDEVKVETQYVEKVVSNCKKETEVVNKIKNLPSVKVGDTSNGQKPKVDIDAELPDDVNQLLQSTNNSDKN